MANPALHRFAPLTRLSPAGLPVINDTLNTNFKIIVKISNGNNIFNTNISDRSVKDFKRIMKLLNFVVVGVAR